MEGAQKRLAIWKLIFRAMSKDIAGLACQESLLLQEIQVRIKGDSAQNDDNFSLIHRGEFAMQMTRARYDLLRRRLVRRRSAMHRRRDVSASQLQAILLVNGRRL